MTGMETAVARWRDRLAELDEQPSPIAAGEALWRRIETDLDEAGVPVSQPSPARNWSSLWTLRDLWQSLAFWRVAGMTGAFASLLLALDSRFSQRARRAIRLPWPFS